MACRPPQCAITGAHTVGLEISHKNIYSKDAPTYMQNTSIAKPFHAMRISIFLLIMMLTSGCSTYHPWQNSIASNKTSSSTQNEQQSTSGSIVAAITLSGGGARAAAFGLGVLQELKNTSFMWEGKSTSILDHINLISGVSGGSILATYYAAFGDRTFTHFESEFLLSDFETSLITTALTPNQLYKLTSPWYGRSQILSAKLDELYKGMTFHDLKKRTGAPDLLVTATDLTTGAAFEYTNEQFNLICSDLDSVPLGFAVASSSAVPIILTPLTLRNYAIECPKDIHSEYSSNKVQIDDNYRSRMLKSNEESYKDAAQRPYLHLVDGGLTDNLGIRTLIDRIIADGSVQNSFRNAAPGSIRRLVLISINSERDLAERIDQSDKIPTMGQVADGLLFGVGARDTKVTLAMLNDDIERWRKEINEHRGTKSSPFSSDAELHLINLSLRDITDKHLRRTLLQVPTAFSVTATHVKQLQMAGREVLRQSPDFRRMLNSFEKPVND